MNKPIAKNTHHSVVNTFSRNEKKNHCDQGNELNRVEQQLNLISHFYKQAQQVKHIRTQCSSLLDTIFLFLVFSNSSPICAICL